MPLQINKEFKTNIGTKETVECFATIDELSYFKTGLTFKLSFYRMDNKKFLLGEELHSFAPDELSGDNFVKKAYKYIKTVYRSATDVQA